MNNFEFEPLQALPVRSEEEQDKEIWQPSWQCFCCQDTGKIQPNLVQRVIPSYNYERDRLPICQNCNKGHDWYHLNEFGVIDTRISPQVCKKLDAIAREEWYQTTQQKFMNIQALAKKKAMPGVCDRSPDDNTQVQRKKAEIEAITHSQWMVMRKLYLGGENGEDEIASAS